MAFWECSELSQFKARFLQMINFVLATYGMNFDLDFNPGGILFSFAPLESLLDFPILDFFHI